MNRFCHEPRHYEHTPNNKSASVWVPPCVTWPHAFNFLFNELQPYTMARLRQTRMRRTSQTNAHTAKRRRNNTIPESNKNKFRRGMQPHEDLTTAASSSTTFLLNGLFSVRIVSEALAQCNVIALCMVRVSRTVLAAKTLYDRGRRRASWSVASPPPGECNKSKQNERHRERAQTDGSSRRTLGGLAKELGNESALRPFVLCSRLRFVVFFAACHVVITDLPSSSAYS